jgi:uncharacterized protein (TIGR02246 family)
LSIREAKKKQTRMNPTDDEIQIREVIGTWLKASAENDLDTLLGLMTEDVVFLLPGREPMCGRDGFAAASRGRPANMKIEGKPDIQEISVEGNFAYCWNYLSITITPEGSAPMRHAGNILSVFRKEADGRWRLFRDANMLQAVEEGK